MRLDQYISENFSLTRNKASQLISFGLISVNNRIIHKKSYEVKDDDSVVLHEDRRIHWVSRSAEKLFGFLEAFPEYKKYIHSKICLDVWASTGGFTQVLLELGASRVDAVEVGHSQLHPLLQSDTRVKSYEETDIRNFISNNTPYSTIVCDASFIRLADIIDSILGLADSSTLFILLFKPQFEVPKNRLSKSWVPKNDRDIERALENFETMLQEKHLIISAKQKASLKWEAWNQEWVYALNR